MIICPKCAYDNPLGRVFCGKCGTKLDFSHTSSQEMSQKSEGSWISENWRKIVYLIVLLLLVPVVMVFWPKSGIVGKPPSNGGEKKVEYSVKAVAAVKKGQLVNAAFAEEDLNAYLQVVKAGPWKVESFSVAAMQGFFKVRMVQSLIDSGKKVGNVPVAIKLSYEVVCVPTTGGNVTVPQAAIGHLPMPGFLRTKVADAIRKKVTSDPDWAPFNSIADIKAENGRFLVTIRP